MSIERPWPPPDAPWHRHLPSATLRLLALVPTDVAFLAAAFCLFALATVGLSWLTGAPFMLPTERTSPALGVPATVPVACAGVGYLAAQIGRSVLRPRPGEDRRAILRLVVTDLSFILAFMSVVCLHFHIKTWMPLVHPRLYDRAYFRIDQQLHVLIAAADAVRASLARVLPAPDLWYQGAQAALLILSFWLHALGDRRWHHHNMTALLLLLMLGPLSYLVAPAVGPFVFEDGPNAVATASQHAMHAVFLAVQAGGPAWLAEHGGSHFTAAVAAMPSLHVALACVVTYYAVKARSLLIPLVVLLSVWIFIESIVSRWHYLVDLPPGILLAVLVIAVTNRVCRWRVTVPAAVPERQLTPAAT
jgi:hypothetical protein